MKADRRRLLDIQDAIKQSEKYARKGREAFERSDLIQVWIIHHLQIPGEAARAEE